jgi:hypothetical protein
MRGTKCPHRRPSLLDCGPSWRRARPIVGPCWPSLKPAGGTPAAKNASRRAARYLPIEIADCCCRKASRIPYKAGEFLLQSLLWIAVSVKFFPAAIFKKAPGPTLLALSVSCASRADLMRRCRWRRE